MGFPPNSVGERCRASSSVAAPPTQIRSFFFIIFFHSFMTEDRSGKTTEDVAAEETDVAVATLDTDASAAAAEVMDVVAAALDGDNAAATTTTSLGPQAHDTRASLAATLSRFKTALSELCDAKILESMSDADVVAEDDPSDESTTVGAKRTRSQQSTPAQRQLADLRKRFEACLMAWKRERLFATDVVKQLDDVCSVIVPDLRQRQDELQAEVQSLRERLAAAGSDTAHQEALADRDLVVENLRGDLAALREAAIAVPRETVVAPLASLQKLTLVLEAADAAAAAARAEAVARAEREAIGQQAARDVHAEQLASALRKVTELAAALDASRQDVNQVTSERDVARSALEAARLELANFRADVTAQLHDVQRALESAKADGGGADGSNDSRRRRRQRWMSGGGESVGGAADPTDGLLTDDFPDVPLPSRKDALRFWIEGREKIVSLSDEVKALLDELAKVKVQLSEQKTVEAQRARNMAAWVAVAADLTREQLTVATLRQSLATVEAQNTALKNTISDLVVSGHDAKELIRFALAVAAKDVAAATQVTAADVAMRQQEAQRLKFELTELEHRREGLIRRVQRLHGAASTAECGAVFATRLGLVGLNRGRMPQASSPRQLTPASPSKVNPPASTPLPSSLFQSDFLAIGASTMGPEKRPAGSFPQHCVPAVDDAVGTVASSAKEIAGRLQATRSLAAVLLASSRGDGSALDGESSAARLVGVTEASSQLSFDLVVCKREVQALRDRLTASEARVASLSDEVSTAAQKRSAHDAATTGTVRHYEALVAHWRQWCEQLWARRLETRQIADAVIRGCHVLAAQFSRYLRVYQQVSSALRDGQRALVDARKDRPQVDEGTAAMTEDDLRSLRALQLSLAEEAHRRLRFDQDMQAGAVWQLSKELDAALARTAEAEQAMARAMRDKDVAALKAETVQSWYKEVDQRFVAMAASQRQAASVAKTLTVNHIRAAAIDIRAAADKASLAAAEDSARLATLKAAEGELLAVVAAEAAAKAALEAAERAMQLPAVDADVPVETDDGHDDSVTVVGGIRGVDVAAVPPVVAADGTDDVPVIDSSLALAPDDSAVAAAAVAPAQQEVPVADSSTALPEEANPIFRPTEDEVVSTDSGFLAVVDPPPAAAAGGELEVAATFVLPAHEQETPAVGPSLAAAAAWSASEDATNDGPVAALPHDAVSSTSIALNGAAAPSTDAPEESGEAEEEAEGAAELDAPGMMPVMAAVPDASVAEARDPHGHDASHHDVTRDVVPVAGDTAMPHPPDQRDATRSPGEEAAHGATPPSADEALSFSSPW